MAGRSREVFSKVTRVVMSPVGVLVALPVATLKVIAPFVPE